MMSFEVMPNSRFAWSKASVSPESTVSKAMPRPVCPCGSKNTSTWRTFCSAMRVR